jgi:hypothetical protein
MKLARRMDPDLILHKMLRPREIEVVRVVTTQPGLMRAAYAESLGVAPNSISAYLDALQVAGLVHRRGFGRGATWWPGAEPPKVVEMARVKVVNSVWSMA